MKPLLAVLLLLSAPITAHASIGVVTTLPDLADFARVVGGDRVRVDHIVRGDQNPHFVEVKPSYMLRLKSADVFLMIGMELEFWAPQIIDGSRNDRLRVVDLSVNIDKLEVPARIDRSRGDVHRFGNPHYWLDPRNVRAMLETIVQAFVQISPEDEQYFRENAESYLKVLGAKIAAWEKLMRPYAGRKIITFHRSWSYFASWLGLVVAEQVEPYPGIPPSPSHTARVIRMVRDGGIRAIVVEPFYDPSAPEQIAGKTDARVVRLPTSVGGVEEAQDYIGLLDYNVSMLASALE